MIRKIALKLILGTSLAFTSVSTLSYASCLCNGCDCVSCDCENGNHCDHCED